MPAQPTSHRLATPGADLYYEVRGSGPLLLAVGQPMTSGAFGPLADLLAEDRTVVTYDPHGLGQSTLDDPSLPITPEVEADDLAHLITAVGDGPAEVFGSSGGAVAGLALVDRHPQLVRTLVAHEPPVVELLPDAGHVRAAVDDTVAAFRSGGSGAGWAKFVSLVMHRGPVTEAGVPPVTWWPPQGADSGDPAAPSPTPEQVEKQQADDALFFLRMLQPFTRYRPSVDSVGSAGPRIVIAIGETSEEELSGRSTRALAQQLGTPPVTFPGDHAGFVADPAAFAERLLQTLRSHDSVAAR